MKNESVNPKKIMSDVALDFGITLDELVGRSRRSHLVRARKESAKRMLQAGMRISDIAFYMQRKYHNIAHYFRQLSKDIK